MAQSRPKLATFLQRVARVQGCKNDARCHAAINLIFVFYWGFLLLDQRVVFDLYDK